MKTGFFIDQIENDCIDCNEWVKSTPAHLTYDCQFWCDQRTKFLSPSGTDKQMHKVFDYQNAASNFQTFCQKIREKKIGTI